MVLTNQFQFGSVNLCKKLEKPMYNFLGLFWAFVTSDGLSNGFLKAL